jgi:hypothetical protein
MELSIYVPSTIRLDLDVIKILKELKENSSKCVLYHKHNDAYVRVFANFLLKHDINDYSEINVDTDPLLYGPRFFINAYNKKEQKWECIF